MVIIYGVALYGLMNLILISWIWASLSISRILNTFGVLNTAVENNILLIKRCVKITVFINSANDFIEQPKVADGASNLIHNILGKSGNHTRSAVSVNSLPKNSSVEIDSIFEIDIER